MKDPLDYTEDELKSLSIEELEELKSLSLMKKDFYNTKQLVEKTLINSLYGAIGNVYFPLYNEDIACAITGNGRYFIRLLANNIENKLQSLYESPKPYITYGDTDSIYYQIEPFVNIYKEINPGLTINEYVEWADAFEKKIIQQIIKSTIDNFADNFNAMDKSVIGVEREIIADAIVFNAKKKYFARVRDSEGVRYDENNPYIKVMGLEIAKSSTPLWAKKKLKEAIPHILDKNENDLKDWLKSIKKEFISANPNDICLSGSASNLNYTLGQKGIPIGSRAALVHNNYINSNNLSSKYTLIEPGDKSKRLFLVQPNKLNSDIVSFSNEQFIEELFDESGNSIIDYDKCFEKGFLSALKLMTNALNYNLDKETNDLDDW